MDDEIYEVSRAEYADFIKTLKIEARRVETQDTETCVWRIKTNELFCKRVREKDDKEHYYIYTLPDASESLPAIPRRHVQLQTKEEVQAFFNALTEYGRTFSKHS